MNDILLVLNGHSKAAVSEAAELAGFARRLQAIAGGSIHIWLLGDGIDGCAAKIARTTGFSITVLHSPVLNPYVCEAYRDILSPLIDQAAPAFVCTGHTSCGWEWAPAVAARIDAGCLCAVDGLALEDDRIVFTRDLYGGKVKGRYVSNTATTIVTVQPGCFGSEPFRENPTAGRIRQRPVDSPLTDTRFDGVGKGPLPTAAISAARVIVAAGNGVGKAENIALVAQLADIFPSAAVAGTRIVCDRGWLGYDRQVGVTGATVAPALYIACGISGASQHLMGMRGAGYVVAVNTDDRAPIFSEADLCITEDLTTFIPLLIERYRELAEAERPGER